RPVGVGEASNAQWMGTYSLGGDIATNESITFDINFATGRLIGTGALTRQKPPRQPYLARA
nr:hypothetical protein [Pseudomonadota bacterium]